MYKHIANQQFLAAITFFWQCVQVATYTKYSTKAQPELNLQSFT